MITFVFFSLFLQSKIDTFSGQALSNIVQIPKNVQPDKNTAKALLRILDKTVKTLKKTPQPLVHTLHLTMQSKYRTRRGKETRKEGWGHELLNDFLEWFFFSIFFPSTFS